MFKRTLYLFFGILLAISSGSVSIYPIYSYYIKNKFNYSLREINLYGSFINIGTWIAFGMGMIYDKCGPRVSNILGYIFLPGCLIILYRLIESSYTSINLIVFLIIAFVLGQGSALLYTSALTTSIKNFSKKNSSNVVGLIVSNCAISPSYFASFKAFFESTSIPTFLVFVIIYISVYIVLCFFLFDVVKPKKNYEFRERIFRENKQYFIISIFSSINFIGLLIFIISLIINNIFSIKLPSFIIFPTFHIILLVFVMLVRIGMFDIYLKEKFDKSHGNIIDSNNYFANNPIIERDIKINNNDDINEKNNRVNTESDAVGKINKININLDDKDKLSKKENSENINIRRSLFTDNNFNNQDFNNDFKSDDIRNSQANNINNIEEYNNKEGRISNNRDINDNNKIDNKNIDDINNKENGDNDNNQQNNYLIKFIDSNNISNNESDKENKKENGENNEHNKDVKENNEKEEGEKEGEVKEEKEKEKEKEEKVEKENNDNLNENGNKEEKKDFNENDNNNNDNIENKENLDNQNNNNRMSYPKFSINSDNNENNNVNNDNDVVNYPKFSLTSDNNDNNTGDNNNDYNNYPKFSINKNDDNDNNDNNNNNYNINKTENNFILDKKDILNKISNKRKLESDKKNILETNDNNATNVNFMAYSPSPLNMNYHIEEENEEEENHNKCVLLLSLLRKGEIIKFFFVLLLTMGCMISNVNNIKFIVSSISSDKSLSSTSLDKYPLIYFSFNSISRVIFGAAISDVMGTEYTFTVLLIITCIGLWSQFFGLFMTKFTIYISISLAGITHGSLMTFVPLYCRYYYNVNDLGTVLGFLTTGNAFGSIIIATLIFPLYYHKYSEYNTNIGEYCSGKRCFKNSYAINCILMFVAFLLSYWIYKVDKKKKIKEKVERENMYKTIALCSFNPRVSTGSDNSNVKLTKI